MGKFHLQAPYQPAGDQPKAIGELVEGLQKGHGAQTLLGGTGTGKTFTMANVIAQVNRPTLVVSHNKTLAAQLYSEFKQFFPDNAVEYFVSYYDYYQPEAFLPSRELYIEKDSSINKEIEKLRLHTASSLLSQRRDVIVIASVSCIYGMSNPKEYSQYVLGLQVGQAISRKTFLGSLVNLLYHRQEGKFEPGSFRVRGETVDIYLAYTAYAYRFFFYEEQIEAIHRIAPASGEKIAHESHVSIFPANLFVTSQETIAQVISQIQEDLDKQVRFFMRQGKHDEAQRLEERTRLDIEMLIEVGYCSGIENYSRYFDRREAGERPYCLMDYFPDDYLMFIDESHVTLPQVRAMWGGDQARKQHLVGYGFRLPAATDNRPLTFQEFESLIHQVIYVSATPSDYELTTSQGVVVEQIIRPTGLLDPRITVVPTRYQMDHLLEAIHTQIAAGGRTLVTTLTKRMAEDLSSYLARAGVKCSYLHSEIKTLERVVILQQLREGVFDVLVGVNLLREGLDLPEVSLVAILDADKEGFLRNARSLIQTIGRAARHLSGQVIMYADKKSPAMVQAIEETTRRRGLQEAYNKRHGVQPKALHKKGTGVTIQSEVTGQPYAPQESTTPLVADPLWAYLSLPALEKMRQEREREMKAAAEKKAYKKAQSLYEELLRLTRYCEEKTKQEGHTPSSQQEE